MQYLWDHDGTLKGLKISYLTNLFISNNSFGGFWCPKIVECSVRRSLTKKSVNIWHYESRSMDLSGLKMVKNFSQAIHQADLSRDAFLWMNIFPFFYLVSCCMSAEHVCLSRSIFIKFSLARSRQPDQTLQKLESKNMSIDVFYVVQKRRSQV